MYRPYPLPRAYGLRCCNFARVADNMEIFHSNYLYSRKITLHIIQVEGDILTALIEILPSKIVVPMKLSMLQNLFVLTMPNETVYGVKLISR